MSATYYRLVSDFENLPDQWFLRGPLSADGETIDPCEFTEGVPYTGPVPVRVPVRQLGKEAAFSLGALDLPVVSQTVREIIERVAPGAAEYFPVIIEGAKCNYAILNITRRVECLDEGRSEFTLWTEEDDSPELVGHYRMISMVCIDHSRAAGHHLFRLSRWTLDILVSDTLKSAIEDLPNLGVAFIAVT